MRDVGERLRELRERLNMSQAELGAQLGLKRSALGKHERGECFPTGRMLKILATKYNASIDYLLCNRGTLFYDKDKAKLRQGAYTINEETEELLYLMTHVPLVRHSVMGFFQRFKHRNQDIIQQELIQKTNRSE